MLNCLYLNPGEKNETRPPPRPPLQTHKHIFAYFVFITSGGNNEKRGDQPTLCHNIMSSVTAIPESYKPATVPNNTNEKKNKICSHCSYTSRIHDLLISPAAILHPICPYAHSYVLTLASPPPLHTNDEHKTLIILKPKRFILFYLITV